MPLTVFDLLPVTRRLLQSLDDQSRRRGNHLDLKHRVESSSCLHTAEFIFTTEAEANLIRTAACLFWMVSFTVILRPFQSPVALAMSSPTFLGDWRENGDQVSSVTADGNRKLNIYDKKELQFVFRTFRHRVVHWVGQPCFLKPGQSEPPLDYTRSL